MVPTDTVQWIGVGWFEGRFGGPPIFHGKPSGLALNQSVEHCESFNIFHARKIWHITYLKIYKYNICIINKYIYIYICIYIYLCIFIYIYVYLKYTYKSEEMMFKCPTWWTHFAFHRSICHGWGLEALDRQLHRVARGDPSGIFFNNAICLPLDTSSCTS